MRRVVRCRFLVSCVRTRHLVVAPQCRAVRRFADTATGQGKVARSQLREALSSGDVLGIVESLRHVSDTIQASDAQAVMVPEEWLIRALQYVVRYHQPVVPEDAAARQDPPVSLRRKLLRGASDIWVAADAILHRAEVLRRATTSPRARAAIPALQDLAERIPEDIFRDILWLARRQGALHRGREWASLWQLRSSTDAVCARHVAALAAFDGDVRSALEVLQHLRETSGNPLRRSDFHPLLEHAASSHDEAALLRIVDHLKRQRVWGRERLNPFHRHTPAWARAVRVACGAQDIPPASVAVDALWEDGFTAASHVAQVCLKQGSPFVQGAKTVLRDVEARLAQEIAWDLGRTEPAAGTEDDDDEEKEGNLPHTPPPRPHVSLMRKKSSLPQSLAAATGEAEEEETDDDLHVLEESVAVYDKWGTALSLLEFSVLLTLHLRNHDPDASLATLRHLLRHVARESVAVTWTFAFPSCPMEVVGHVQLTALCLAHAGRWDAAMELCLRVEERWGLPARATGPGAALARAAVASGRLDEALDLLTTVVEGRPLEQAKSRAKRRAEQQMGAALDTARRVQLSERLDRMHSRVVPRFRRAAQEGFARAAEQQDWARMSNWLHLCQQWGAKPEVGSVVDAWVSSLIHQEQDAAAVELAREAGEWLGWMPSRACAVETVHFLLERGHIALAASFVEAFPVDALRDHRIPPPGLREASAWLHRVRRILPDVDPVMRGLNA